MYISFQKLSIHFPIFLNKAPKETSKWVEMLLVQFQFSKKYSTLLSFHNYEIDQNLLIIISEFIEYWTNSYIFILCLSNLKTLFLASNKWTSNIQSNRAITRFFKLLWSEFEHWFFKTSNGVEHVHLLISALKLPLFDFEQSKSNFEHSLTKN